MQPKVTNTTREMTDNPGVLLARAMLFGASESIYMQEAEGQRELVLSDQIPTDTGDITDEVLTSLGFKLGPPTPDDPMFRVATLPPGWRKERTDHSMWSKIVDAKERVRFMVFYKAASYDRKARMNIQWRFGYSVYHDGSTADHYAAVITDGGKVVETIGERRKDDRDGHDRFREACVAWLDDRYPDHANPLAYWD
jgi:hypothetical protein